MVFFCPVSALQKETPVILAFRAYFHGAFPGNYHGNHLAGKKNDKGYFFKSR